MLGQMRVSDETTYLGAEPGHGPAGGAFLGIRHKGDGRSVEDVDAAMDEVIPVMNVPMDVRLHLWSRSEDFPERL
jgi:hypothetical protein